MGQGLSRGSPVQLSFGKDNYEALIERHGQWVRWRTARKCSCVKPSTQQPDIHCEICSGLGVIFGCQKKAVVTATVLVRDSSGNIELEDEYKDCELVKAYDNSGKVYPYARKFGRIVSLYGCPVKGSYVTCVLEKNIIKKDEQNYGVHEGAGFYRIRNLVVSRKNIEGLYHDAPADILSIEKVYDDITGQEYAVKEFRQNGFFVRYDETEVLPEVIAVKNVEYIEPFVFAVLSQELTKGDAEAVQESNGEAIVSFPYPYDVADDDVITVLAGTITTKKVLARLRSVFDVLPAYFVESISGISGKTRDYIQGDDYILVGTNRIQWLCDDAPAPGEAYSVTYRVCPTYKVVKQIPALRTSENQRLPKKAVVKYYDTYGEARGVNRQ